MNADVKRCPHMHMCVIWIHTFSDCGITSSPMSGHPGYSTEHELRKCLLINKESIQLSICKGLIQFQKGKSACACRHICVSTENHVKNNITKVMIIVGCGG